MYKVTAKRIAFAFLADGYGGDSTPVSAQLVVASHGDMQEYTYVYVTKAGLEELASMAYAALDVAGEMAQDDASCVRPIASLYATCCETIAHIRKHTRDLAMKADDV